MGYHEYKLRLINYMRTDNFVTQNNAGSETHVAAHNLFSDWHYAEYTHMLGYHRSQMETRDRVKVYETVESSNGSLFGDLEVDWVTAGAVTPVKDQGQCGSCWSFSTTGSLEGAHQIATGELLSFSEQQLVDCAGIQEGYQNMGCNGGLQSYAYAYYEDSHNAELETVYPYVSGSGRKTACTYDAASATSVTVSDYLDVTPSSPTQMQAALNKQPLAVAIQANKMVFQTYKSGVLTSAKCCGSLLSDSCNLDHAVLAVGYGTEDGQDYWLVKNSWNTTWGDEGYIKLGMDTTDGICGVQLDPQAPTTN